MMKLFLIDGHALIFKMYYAFLGRHIVNSRGVDTSILFGFTKYLLELIDREKPSHLAVSFDPPGGTFRNRLYPEYKANRTETPQLVIDALEPLRGIVGAMNIPVLMVPDYEADDVIGSAAVRFASDGLDVYMVTPDKDCWWPRTYCSTSPASPAPTTRFSERRKSAENGKSPPRPRSWTYSRSAVILRTMSPECRA